MMPPTMAPKSLRSIRGEAREAEARAVLRRGRRLFVRFSDDRRLSCLSSSSCSSSLSSLSSLSSSYASQSARPKRQPDAVRFSLARLRYSEAAKHVAKAAGVFPPNGAYEDKRISYLLIRCRVLAG